MSIKTNKHRGQILKNTIEKMGFKITDIARRKVVSRGTVYNHFNDADLDDKTLMQYGKIIRYDFSIHFPELIPLKGDLDEKDMDNLSSPAAKELTLVQRKYYELLEQHAALLRFLFKAGEEYGIEALRTKVAAFLDIQSKEEEEA